MWILIVYTYILTVDADPFPDTSISRMACSLHLMSSVGHRVRAAKKAAQLPDTAFCTADNSDTSRVPKRQVFVSDYI